MFDVGASELLLTVIVAIVVIGPKDLPRALRMAGRWIGKMRRISGHFRSGIEEMIRQAELEDMEKKWREQNEAIMAQTAADPTGESAAVGTPEALPSPYTTPAPYEAPHQPIDVAADPAAPELPLGEPQSPVKP